MHILSFAIKQATKFRIINKSDLLKVDNPLAPVTEQEINKLSLTETKYLWFAAIYFGNLSLIDMLLKREPYYANLDFIFRDNTRSYRAIDEPIDYPEVDFTFERSDDKKERGYYLANLNPTLENCQPIMYHNLSALHIATGELSTNSSYPRQEIIDKLLAAGADTTSATYIQTDINGFYMLMTPYDYAVLYQDTNASTIQRLLAACEKKTTKSSKKITSILDFSKILAKSNTSKITFNSSKFNYVLIDPNEVVTEEQIKQLSHSEKDYLWFSAVRFNKTKIVRSLLEENSSHYLKLTCDLEIHNNPTIAYHHLNAVHLPLTLEMLNLLLEFKADPNAVYTIERTKGHHTGKVAPLHMAAQTGNRDWARALLLHGANLNAQLENNKARMTPLDFAVANGDDAMVELFQSFNASTKGHDEKGNTSLHRAAQDGNKRMVVRLLEAATNQDAPNDLGDLAVEIAIFKGHIDIVEYMLAKGNFSQEYINRFLYVAAANLQPEIIKLLISQYGADKNAKCTGKTKTALQAVPNILNIAKLWAVKKAFNTAVGHQSVSRTVVSAMTQIINPSGRVVAIHAKADHASVLFQSAPLPTPVEELSNNDADTVDWSEWCQSAFVPDSTEELERFFSTNAPSSNTLESEANKPYMQELSLIFEPMEQILDQETTEETADETTVEEQLRFPQVPTHIPIITETPVKVAAVPLLSVKVAAVVPVTVKVSTPA